MCFRLRIVRRSDQSVSLMSFPSQIFFNDINHGYRAAILKKRPLWVLPLNKAMATYCYYEKVRRTMRTVIVSYLLKTIFTSGSNLNSLLCRNKTKLLPNSYPGVMELKCTSNLAYFSENKKIISIRP